MTGCRHEKTIERRVDFKGMKALVELLERIGKQNDCKRGWARQFALSILEFAAEKGFDKVTFESEQKLEGFELLVAIKRRFADPNEKMNALRLWNGDKNILLRIKSEGVIIYSSDHMDLAFTLPDYKTFHEFWNDLEEFVSEPHLNELVLAEPPFKA